MTAGDSAAARRPYDVTVLDAGSAGELLTLQRAAYLSEARAHGDFDLPPLVQTLDEVRAELADPDVVALGVTESGRILGSVRLRRVGAAVELGRLAVVPDRQGEGIGTCLLLHAETVFPGAREIRLFTGEHSLADIRLYERCGYAETGRTSAGSYALIHFAKRLA
jgi:ribosomal protein S18 acetylase RimI-like enzyme